MAVHDLQVILRNANGLARDDYVNTFHYEVNAPDTLEGCMDDLAAAYTGLAPVMHQDINSLTIKSYAPGLNPGGPEKVKDYAFNPSAVGGPHEIALCLSYKSNDAGDPKRRRGRVYIGPLALNAIGSGRPDATLRDYALDFGERLASVGNLGNTTWRIHSRIDNSYHDIDVIWCDDAWDTQRRRGLRPTLRESRNVQ